MASMMSTSKPVQKMESDTATVHFSGAVLTGSDSDSETPSESEQDEETLNNQKGDDAIIDVNKKVASNPICHLEKDVNCIEKIETNQNLIEPVDTTGISPVMVNSSDSGCPCSPLEESSSENREENIPVKNSDTSSEQRDNDISATINFTNPLQKTETDNNHGIVPLNNNADDKGSKMTIDINSDGCSDLISKNASSVVSPTRFNPFNTADADEQDPFPQLSQRISRNTDDEEERCGSTSPDLWPENELRPDTNGDSGIISSELGIREDYFAQPEGALSIEEMEAAIESFRKIIMDHPPESEHKKNLVHKLVQLRLKLAEAKEEQVTPDPSIKMVVGHTFVLKDSQRSRRYCEQCNSVIWGVLQGWFRCDSCGFCCHEKCLDLVTRSCASIKVKEFPEFIVNICPEKYLSSQSYKCAECRTPISYHSSQGEPRLCDYSGSFYCDRCHWNDLMIIPSRVLHNWDFEPRKVCRGTKQFLRLMKNKAVLRVQDINPMLFNFVEEINDVKKLREEILIMKKYFLSCKAALQSKLLLQLQERQHFVENSDMYSLQDLQDVATDVLLPQLAKIHASFAQHIKTDCELCKCKGYHCELCADKEILFPFDNIAIVCSQCSTVLHRHCYMRKNQKCPKCTRRDSRND